LHFTEPHLTKLGANYEDSNNTIEVKTSLSPFDYHLPPIAASYSRKLFRDRPHRGRVSLNISHSPSIALFFHSPARLRLDDDTGSPKLSPPSISGLQYLAFEKGFGLRFDNILPKLVAEGAIHLIELSTRLKATLECGLAGLLATLRITWSNEKAEAGTLLVFSADAVIWEIKSVCSFDGILQPLLIPSKFFLSRCAIHHTTFFINSFLSHFGSYYSRNSVYSHLSRVSLFYTASSAGQKTRVSPFCMWH